MKKLLIILTVVVAAVTSCRKVGYSYSDLFTFSGPDIVRIGVDTTQNDELLISSQVSRFTHAKVSVPTKTKFKIITEQSTAIEGVDFSIISNELDFSEDPDKMFAYARLMVYPNKITESKYIVLQLDYEHKYQQGDRIGDTKKIVLVPLTANN